MALVSLQDYGSTSEDENQEDTSNTRRTKQEMAALEAKRKKRSQHGIVPGSCEECILGCTSKICREKRSLINETYWSMTPAQQKSFIRDHVQQLEVKRRRVDSDDPRKMFTYKYHLKDSMFCEQNVCAKVFLNTIGYKNSCSNIISRALKAGEPDESKIDRRGVHQQLRSRTLKEVVTEDILLYQPTISHYRRAHAPNVKYLPSDLSAKRLFDAYIAKQTDDDNKCSYQYYCGILRDMNIKFTKLGLEECETCEIHRRHLEETNHETNDENPDPCEKCTTWADHDARAKLSREEYHKDKSNQKAVIMSVDLQKVVQIPRMDGFKTVIFTKRINALHQTFAPVGGAQNGSVYGLVWDESISGRKAADIASCFYRYLVIERAAKHIVLWLDNCSSQNKNWNLFLFMILLINSTLVETNVLEFKFFEPGHTFMSADSFHHVVEKNMKSAAKGEVHTFEDFYNCVNTAQDNSVAVKMQASDFFTCDITCKPATKQRTRPKLNEVKHIVFSRGSYNFTYSNNFSGATKSCNLFTRNQLRQVQSSTFDVSSTMHFRVAPKGVELTRKEGIIQKIVPLLPPEKKMFWYDLPTHDGSSDEES